MTLAPWLYEEEHATFEPIRSKPREVVSDPRFQCANKQRYVSKTRARWSARAMRGGGSKVSVYRCPHCKAFFHLGNR